MYISLKSFLIQNESNTVILLFKTTVKSTVCCKNFFLDNNSGVHLAWMFLFLYATDKFFQYN